MNPLAAEVLSGWLAPVTKGAAKRENAIRDAGGALASVTDTGVLDLVLLAFGEPDGATVERVGDAVRGHDPGFIGRPTDAQTHVAAAWAVAQTIDGQDADTAALAAMAVQSARFAGLSTRGAELHAHADSYLVERSEQARSREPLAKLPTSVPKALAELTFAQGVNASTDQLLQLLAATTSALTTVSTRSDRLRQSIDRRLRAADEELDLLWWALRRRPDGLAETWKDVGPAAGILAGRDMKRLTRFAVAIRSSGVLLSEALDGCDDTTLAEAASATAGQADAPGATAHRLLPVAEALRDPTMAAAGPHMPLRPADLAEQVLREQLMEELL